MAAPPTGLVKVEEGAHHEEYVRCDALILDDHSRSDTYPYMEIDEKDARIGHEATVSVGDDQFFYLMSRYSHRATGHRNDRERLHRADHQDAADEYVQSSCLVSSS
jgi:hypothetical protein